MTINDYVTNFLGIIQILKNMGKVWNPVNPLLTIPALEERHQNAENMRLAVQNAEAFDSRKTKERELAYEPLTDLVHRAHAAADSGGMDEISLDKLGDIKDLITGANIGKAAIRRAKKNEKALALLPEGATLENTPKEHSVSKLAYDKRYENFEKFITCAVTAGNYATNRSDLTLAALTSFGETLKLANLTTENAYKLLESKRDERDELFDGKTNSISFVARKIKKELVSMEGLQGLNVQKMTAFSFDKLI